MSFDEERRQIENFVKERLKTYMEEQNNSPLAKTKSTMVVAEAVLRLLSLQYLEVVQSNVSDAELAKLKELDSNLLKEHRCLVNANALSLNRK